ncbi:hypothetical protein M409DRAFT_24772 [Zasmidium cellare ATCC 36951]|uniref:Myb-like DNA-binding domain-containing protein n=1 Tax=Zasmidium cellare ATCC 36951 TaxID=1080233 RepID=A0A6A6CCE4_ZASCE|nr:uncharacterized protein M409DRAFT_24772 [Zasmidium cellare ATCC 36951]KAF2164867.1 hypothetical protein M409DRAFT_24772 [Zasmidium cellare ATCC 36951]
MSLTLNARQQALLIAVVRNTTADIDWDKVAAETDYGTAKSARDNWSHTRKKIENTFSGASAAGGTPVKKGIARKRKAGDEETPAKKKCKKKVGKEMSPADEDDVEEKKVVKDEA